MDIKSANNINRTQMDPSLVQKKMDNLKGSPDDQSLMDACKEFESIFTYMMLKEMKKTVPEDGLVEKSQGTTMFEEMHLEQLAKEMSQGDNGIGIARALYDQFKQGNVL